MSQLLADQMHDSAIDILIVGGGPAGLMAAKYLSKRHRVILIERATLGQTKKCWVTTKRRLQKHGLEECVLSQPTRMSAGTFLGANITVTGDFAVVDDERLLQTLVRECEERGTLFKENCKLLNVSWKNQRIVAQTTQGRIEARLVIDATGGLSPLANSFGLNRIDGFYSIYGCMLRGIRLHTDEIILGYINELGNPPPILELFPTGVDSAYFVVFVYSKNLVTPQALANSFEDHCRYNPFFELTSNTSRESEKAGAIPIGQRRKNRLAGIIPFGEAGLIQPPLMGTAFNEVLEHAEDLCAQISQRLEAPTSEMVCFDLTYSLLKRLQDRIQLPIVRAILGGDVERFDTILRAMSHFPERLLFNFFSNELSWSQVGSLAMRLPWLLLKRGKVVLRN